MLNPADAAKSRLKAGIRVFMALMAVAVASVVSSGVRLHTLPPIRSPFGNVDWRDLLVGSLVALTFILGSRFASGLKMIFALSWLEGYERILYRKRLKWGLWIAAPTLAVLETLRHLEPFGARIDWKWEATITVIFLMAGFVLSESQASHCVFGIPRRQDMCIPQLWWEFVGRYGAAKDEAKAELLMFLFKWDGDAVELRVTFSQYLKILRAATEIAQREWFATYTFRVSEWANINQHAQEYFVALKATHLKRTRVVIRPRAEIVTINEGSRILIDTRASGAVLERLALESIEESIQQQGLTIEDCAIFDERFAVVGIALSNAQQIEPNSFPLTVKLLKGTSASTFLTMKTFLESQLDPSMRLPAKRKNPKKATKPGGETG